MERVRGQVPFKHHQIHDCSLPRCQSQYVLRPKTTKVQPISFVSILESCHFCTHTHSKGLPVLKLTLRNWKAMFSTASLTRCDPLSMILFSLAGEDELGSRTIISSTDAIMNHAIEPLATIHDAAPCTRTRCMLSWADTPPN